MGLDPTPEARPSDPKGALRMLGDPLAAVCAGISFLAVFVFAWHTIVSPDYWWHLHTGELVLRTGAIPQTNSFSFSSPDTPWINSHWLFQVVLALAYRVGGHTGSLVLQTGVLLAAFLFLRAALRPIDHPGVSLLAVLGTLLVVQNRFFVRPHVFTFLFVAVFLFVLEGFRRNETARLGWLVVCQWLWANMHGEFVLGLFMAAVYVVGSSVRFFSRREDGDVNAIPKRQRLTGIGVCLAACVLVCLANPNGIQGALYPFRLFGEIGESSPTHMQAVTELVPPFEHTGSTPPGFLRWYLLVAVMLLLSVVFNLRRVPLEHLLLGLGFFYLSLLASRNTADFALVAVPIACLNLGPWLPALKQRKRWDAALTGLAILAACWLVQDVASNRFYERNGTGKRFGSGVSPGVSDAAIDFLNRNPSERIFCNPESSGVLMARVQPSPKVFLDGRWEAYDRRVMDDYEALMKADFQTWQDFSVQSNVQTALFMHAFTAFSPLVKELFDCRSWELSFLDETCAVFMKGPRGAAPLSAEEDRTALLESLLSRPEQWNEPLGSFFLTVGKTELAETVIRSELNDHPSRASLWLNLGVVAARQARPEDARRHFDHALKLDPRLAEAHLNIGILQLKDGQRKEASESFSLALKYSHPSLLTWKLAKQYQEERGR